MKLSDITRQASTRVIREQGEDEGRGEANDWRKVGDLAEARGGSQHAGEKTALW